MKRTIKFRGKRLDIGKWVYGYLADGYSINDINAPVRTIIEVDSHTVGQFTGLLDRNGKEIYEGDILRGALHNHVVKFKNGIFFAEVEDEYGYDCIKPTLFKATEVIGNIHEQSKS